MWKCMYPFYVQAHVQTLWAPRLEQQLSKTQSITDQHLAQLINSLCLTGLSVPAVLYPLLSLGFNWEMTVADHCRAVMIQGCECLWFRFIRKEHKISV